MLRRYNATRDPPMTFAPCMLLVYYIYTVTMVHLGGAGFPDLEACQKARGSSALQCVLFRIEI